MGQVVGKAAMMGREDVAAFSGKCGEDAAKDKGEQSRYEIEG